MQEQDCLYFAQELQDITSRLIPTSFGEIHALTAGIPGQPLILVVHGSGPKNSSEQYAYLLHQYLVRVSYLEKFYIVAIDCPGYGQSEGRKEAVRTFPLQLFREILTALNYKSYYAMFGHSQGGASIFNAVYEAPSIAQFLVMDRPVCGNIQRFRKFSLPTLLIYDIEDDGHPIWQGKLLFKQLMKTQFYTYRASLHPFWVPDNIWDKMLGFFAKQHKVQRKLHVNFEGEKRSRSTSNSNRPVSSKIPRLKKNSSVDRIAQIKKNEFKQQELLRIEEVQRSELMSLPSSDFPSEEEKQQILRNHSSDQSKSESVEEQLSQKAVRMPRFAELAVRPKLTKRQSPQPKVQELPEQQQGIHQAQVQLEEEPNRCAICYQTLYRPVVTNCNHIFCNKCMLQSLLVSQKCPLCRAKITKKTQNKELQDRILSQLSESDRIRREKEFVRIENMMKSIVYIEIGNTSRELATKQSAFTKTKKKYTWELFVKPARGFPVDEVSFNINMGDRDSRPVRVRNAPYTFESRGTFSFDCEIIIKPKNNEYGPLTAIYRIDIEPGYHSRKVALRKKCYMK